MLECVVDCTAWLRWVAPQFCFQIRRRLVGCSRSGAPVLASCWAVPHGKGERWLWAVPHGKGERWLWVMTSRAAATRRRAYGMEGKGGLWQISPRPLVSYCIVWCFMSILQLQGALLLNRPGGSRPYVSILQLRVLLLNIQGVAGHMQAHFNCGCFTSKQTGGSRPRLHTTEGSCDEEWEEA